MATQSNRGSVVAAVLAALGMSAAMIPAASAEDGIPKARISINCVSADVVAPEEALGVEGMVTKFVWTRNGGNLKNVARTGKLPLVCDSDEITVETPQRDAISVGIPPRANGLSYRVEVKETVAEDVRGPRTVCKGEINFRRSIGDLAAAADVVDLGDVPRYRANCELGGGNKAVFRVRPFIRELPAVE